MKKWYALAAIPLLLAASACGSADSDAHSHRTASGDLQERTASASTPPHFLTEQPQPIQQIYALAVGHTDLLKWLPCYCGCGESAGHRSNMNCFVQSVGEDGSVVWDDHGTRCNVCMEIAVSAIQLQKEGKTVKEIRALIDQRYQKGYAKPTDTELPL